MNRPTSPRLWNTVNLTELAGAAEGESAPPIDFARLGIADPASTFEGLVPAINDRLGPARRVKHPAYPPIETCEFFLEDHEALAHIAMGPPTLVTTSTHKDPTKFVRRICCSFPKSDIVVMVRNKEAGYPLVQALREDGHTSWYMQEEGGLKADAPYRNDRIRVVRQDKLALWSLDLHRADIVVATDAVGFIRGDYFAHHTELFNTQQGTCIKPGARLVGIVGQEAHPRDLRRVYPIFGLRNHILGSGGRAFLAPVVQWLTRAKVDHSQRSVGSGAPPSALKEKTIWTNERRNNFIAKKIRGIQASLDEHGFIQERVQADPENAVAIVVENLIHQATMKAALASKHVDCLVLTFQELANKPALPPVLVRADAGVGLLPIRVSGPILVVDVKDETPGFLRAQMNRRKQAYARHWHLAPKPFLSRLLEALGKPKPSPRPG